MSHTPPPEQCKKKKRSNYAYANDVSPLTLGRYSVPLNPA